MPSSQYGNLTEQEVRDLIAMEGLNAQLQGDGPDVNNRLAFSSLEGVRAPAQGNLKRASARKENQLDRDTILNREAMRSGGRLAEAQMLAQAMGSDPYAGLTDPEARTAREQAQTFTGLDSAIQQGESIIASGDDFKGFTDPIVGALRDWDMQGTANSLVNLIYNPKEKSARSAFGSAIGQWRKSLSGSAVTGIETTLGADWDPTASGIGQVEAVDRAKRLQKYINGNREVLGLEGLGGEASGEEEQYEFRTLKDGTRQRRKK